MEKTGDSIKEFDGSEGFWRVTKNKGAKIYMG